MAFNVKVPYNEIRESVLSLTTNNGDNYINTIDWWPCYNILLWLILILTSKKAVYW